MGDGAASSARRPLATGDGRGVVGAAIRHSPRLWSPTVVTARATPRDRVVTGLAGPGRLGETLAELAGRNVVAVCDIGSGMLRRPRRRARCGGGVKE